MADPSWVVPMLQQIHAGIDVSITKTCNKVNCMKPKGYYYVSLVISIIDQVSQWKSYAVKPHIRVMVVQM